MPETNKERAEAHHARTEANRVVDRAFRGHLTTDDIDSLRREGLEEAGDALEQWLMALDGLQDTAND